MEINVYTFPPLSGDLVSVENTFCDLYNRYRNGEALAPEAIDWMDSANIVLITSEDNR